MDFEKLSQQELDEVAQKIKIVDDQGGPEEARFIVNDATIELYIAYHAYLKEKSSMTTISVEFEDTVTTVKDVLNALFDGAFGEEDSEKYKIVMALIEGIYLYFGEENRGKTFYSLDDQNEALLFQIYYDTAVEYDCVHSKHGRMTVAEGVKAFDETRYKQIPANFNSIAAIGNLILEKVVWEPEKLWTAGISRKHANSVLDIVTQIIH